MHINISFPGLEDVILKEFRSFEDRVEIFVEMPVYTHRCPRCGTRTKKIPYSMAFRGWRKPLRRCIRKPMCSAVSCTKYVILTLCSEKRPI